MDNKVIIKGKEYPFRLEFMAVARYQAATGKGLEVTTNLLANLIEVPAVLFYAIERECEVKGEPFDLKQSDIEQALDDGEIQLLDLIINKVEGENYIPDEDELEADAKVEKGSDHKKKE